MLKERSWRLLELIAVLLLGAAGWELGLPFRVLALVLLGVAIGLLIVTLLQRWAR